MCRAIQARRLRVAAPPISRGGRDIRLVLIPFLIVNFLAIHRHYTRAADELATETPLSAEAIQHIVVVPIAAVNRLAIQTLAYACSIAPNVIAVHVFDVPEGMARLHQAWRIQCASHPFLGRVRLRLIRSQYRALIPALMSYIDDVDQRQPGATITVMLPELLFRPGTVVTSVPYHLQCEPGVDGGT